MQIARACRLTEAAILSMEANGFEGTGGSAWGSLPAAGPGGTLWGNMLGLKKGGQQGAK